MKNDPSANDDACSSGDAAGRDTSESSPLNNKPTARLYSDLFIPGLRNAWQLVIVPRIISIANEELVAPNIMF
jgi:hypothetical protein